MDKKKFVEGVVVSNKMDKTIIVKVTRKMRHPRYEKLVERWKKYYAHDEKNEMKIGDKVQIIETRPISKLKRWKVNKALN
jgi:small subunit ribosomal protein S17